MLHFQVADNSPRRGAPSDASSSVGGAGRRHHAFIKNLDHLPRRTNQIRRNASARSARSHKSARSSNSNSGRYRPLSRRTNNGFRSRSRVSTGNTLGLGINSVESASTSASSLRSRAPLLSSEHHSAANPPGQLRELRTVSTAGGRTLSAPNTFETVPLERTTSNASAATATSASSGFPGTPRSDAIAF